MTKFLILIIFMKKTKFYSENRIKANELFKVIKNTRDRSFERTQENAGRAS